MTDIAAGSRPDVSIIIPVFDDFDGLARCLRALEQQTLRDVQWEVVVVDNGSPRSIHALARQFPAVRFLSEPKPGSYAARNCGIRSSRGAIVVFTDADCVPAPDWLERGVTALRQLGARGMIGGRIDVVARDRDRPTAVELYDCIYSFPQEEFLESGFAPTANLFTTRATIDAVGAFNEEFFSGGDMEWGRRVQANGLPQAYAADAIIHHPARRTLRQLLRKIRRVAAGNQQLAEHEGWGTWGLRKYAWRELVLLRRIRASMTDVHLGRLRDKLRFAAVVWAVDAVRTYERYRVHYGGRPRRQ